jgi:hypothetical protein
MNLYTLSKFFYKQAMALSLDPMESIHDKELRELVNKRKIIVFHGTSAANLLKILKHGSLDPAMSGTNKNYEDSSPGIFVTSASNGFMGAEMYAHKSSTITKTDPIVLEIVIPLNWISIDTDDARIDEKGEIYNDLGKRQGIVHRPISIKNIKGIQVTGDISSLNPTKSSNVFDKKVSDWMSIGQFLDLIQKAIKSKKEVDPVYVEMVGGRPKGLSKSMANEDVENILANNITGWLYSFLAPDVSTNEKIFKLVLRSNKFGSAEKFVETLCQALSISKDELMESIDPISYPRRGESLWQWGKRI